MKKEIKETIFNVVDDPALASAMSAIRDLAAAKTEAEARIAECHGHLASEERMLDSLLTEPETTTNKQYLKAAKKAYRAGIKAWKLSVEAYQNDIDTYNAEINDILKRIPEARMVH